MPGFAFTSNPGVPILFSVQEKHLRDPLAPSEVHPVAVALGEPCFKKLRVASRPSMRRRILLDVMETSELFQVKADMPGVGKHNIKVDIEGDMLTLAATAPSCSKALDCNMPTTPSGEQHTPDPCKSGGTTRATPEPAPYILPNRDKQQHAQSSCGDKFACNPCKCTKSVPIQDDGLSTPCAPGAQLKREDNMHVDLKDNAAPEGKAVTKWHSTERARRFKQRAIRIPEGADTSSVSASYTDGVLTVSFRKLAAAAKKTRVLVV